MTDDLLQYRAEFPILAVEAMLAALTSFTLVGPLRLPWWLPLIAMAVIGAASAGLRFLALSTGRRLWQGLAVVRSLNRGSRVIAFVLVGMTFSAFANPAPTLTMFASAIPTSTKRSGNVFWKALMPVEPCTSDEIENTG